MRKTYVLPGAIDADTRERLVAEVSDHLSTQGAQLDHNEAEDQWELTVIGESFTDSAIVHMVESLDVKIEPEQQ